jgi:membrane-bound lytic murein transglycosylase MltF
MQKSACATAVALTLFATGLAHAQSAAPAPSTAPAPSATAAGKSAAPQEGPKPRQFTISNQPRTGDFDMMLERRVIRIAAPFSRSLYYNDKGRERGFTAELARDFERYINTRHKKKLGKRPITVVLIPTTRDKLLPMVAGGLADVAAGNLTVTEERLKLVDMFAPEGVIEGREILLTGPKSPPVAGLDDLSGKTVHVRRASSYYESLVALNKRFKDERKAETKIVLVPDALEDEDMMEMLNTGLLQAMVVDEWKAKLWKPVLSKVVVHAAVALREDARVGWAFRKNSPLLAAELEAFYKNWVKKQGVIAARLQQQMKRVKQLKDPTGGAEWKRFETTMALFDKYGGKYDFDPLMLAAQGYQESQLNQEARSHVGAVGVMQIMPATGQQMRVGDIRQVEANIHAGTKYMDHLMTQYFKDAKFTEANRTLFAFASYNCGPGNVSKMRREATKRGLDPDRWFDNVEIVTAQRIGMETTTYVRNIFKYYVAYKLIVDAHKKVEEAKEAVAPAAN